MLNFSIFDSILEPVFVVAADGLVVYCNDGAATFCATSTRRLVNKQRLDEVLRFEAPDFLPFGEKSPGRTEPTALLETMVTIAKGGRSGRVQMAVRPFGDDLHWGFFLRDVSLEETLAAKYRVELARSEDYARNLEVLVADRTSELNAVNLSLNAILNSLGQGFFTFDANGDCGKVFTRACETILESTPTGRKPGKFWDWEKIPTNLSNGVRLYLANFYRSRKWPRSVRTFSRTAKVNASRSSTIPSAAAVRA